MPRYVSHSCACVSKICFFSRSVMTRASSGAGAAGSVAAKKCAMNRDVFTHVHLASRTLSKCETVQRERPAFARRGPGNAGRCGTDSRGECECSQIQFSTMPPMGRITTTSSMSVPRTVLKMLTVSQSAG